MKRVLLSVCLLAGGNSQAAAPAIPSAQRWLESVEKELAPFWLHQDAAGHPIGNFPTYRCNDGSLYQQMEPCDDLAFAPEWMKPHLGESYTRMQARHTFVYGVIFHLTGDKQALELAKAGVDYLREHLLEEQGSVISVREAGQSIYSAQQRTTQDLAYAQLGMAFYYYLSGDQQVLADILKVKDYIFEQYWDADSQRLRWVNAPSNNGSGDEIELVAQLDQINGYMLLVSPLLPEPHKSQWDADLAKLLDTIISQFLRPQEFRFWGTKHGQEYQLDSARHNDFGHTAKSWWMTWLAAEYLGNSKLALQSQAGLKQTLDAAFIEHGEGGWRRLPNGAPAIWWEYAELDQSAATLALVDPSASHYLASTYPQWFDRFIAEDGGTYPVANKGLKIHLWKSDYHSLEHALVAYLTSAQLNGEPARLYFAMPANQAALRQPYFYQAKQAQASKVGEWQGLPISEVNYQGIGIKQHN
ncbi:hypothetical protein M0C34_05275 [Agarivorans sp. TSD2052]|uniref:hypothetical protein n=1 Tax=Agarivorans sp. TSD2052 TaxID=2937286 RepID=UPI0020109034|nr:hypothetical protein [Agarivorans sp. TSD2052]UPW19694.1 hypothetical protein M0C34_05275 [Agarivorans sp. TSD2052]